MDAFTRRITELDKSEAALKAPTFVTTAPEFAQRPQAISV